MKYDKYLRTPSQNTPGGCFCRQNRSDETKRCSKKIYSTNIFVDDVEKQVNIKFNIKCHFKVMKNEVGRT